jgi:diguanylate cyclase (GGDEF)-like protein/PAS domain S-box-containing protein
MNEFNSSSVVNALKQQAALIGDYVAIYDPVLDALIEFSDCFCEIINLSPPHDSLMQLWINKIQQPSELLKNNLFAVNELNTARLFEYSLNHGDGTEHNIRHTSYAFIDSSGDDKSLILIILRDCGQKNSCPKTLESTDFRKGNNSQLRHMRKAIDAIYKESQVDFIMLAMPCNHKERARSLVAMQNGSFLPEFSYDLAGTPCKLTVNGRICVYENNIQSLFPTDKMLVELSAESYIGMPFFDDNGDVTGFLVLICDSSLHDTSALKKMLETYQPRLNRRLQLYRADQRLFDLKTTNEQFNNEQFSLGAAPSSQELFNWYDLSKEAFNSLKEGIMITDKNSCIVEVNQAFTDITGYSFDDVKGKNPSVLASGLNAKSLYQEMKNALDESGMWEGEIINKTKKGKIYSEWLSIRVVYDANQIITNYVGIFSDLSSHKEREELLYYQANYDPLTMLPNRSLLFFTLAEELEKLKHSSQRLLYLLHFDIKGLAQINENYSYHVGDTLLIETAQRLKRLFNDNTIIARISGDNFVVLFAESETGYSVEKLAQQLLDCIAEPVLIDDLQIAISSNIGIVSTNDSEINTESFYIMAEQALLKAKQKGLNKYFVFDESLQLELRNNWQLEQELALAIDNDEFVLYYQPQVNVVTGKLVGVEALVRWQHPVRGLLAPGYFISMADKTNLIVPLGELILKKACQQINHWQVHCAEKFTVSVNISPKQFALEHTHHTLKNIITKSNIDKSRIILEITEDVLMTSHGDLLDMLRKIEESGIKLSLDDFGTGFSSLAYLQQYPLSELKIDQSFVRSLTSRPESHAIVKAIIAMSKALQLTVLAEGVETIEQRDILAELGCEIFQGYYFSKPLPVDLLHEFILK